MENKYDVCSSFLTVHLCRRRSGQTVIIRQTRPFLDAQCSARNCEIHHQGYNEVFETKQEWALMLFRECVQFAYSDWDMLVHD